MFVLGSSLFGALLIGVPIGIALAGAVALLVCFDPFLTYTTLFKAFFIFTSKYTLMAIPFFIYAGFLMERTGLVGGLFQFADALIGWVPGGFAYATLIAAVLFGSISGSSTASAAAMSVIAYPEMLKRGYPRWMSAGVIASSGGIALLIPPSLTLILYGVITEESIIELFFAGIIPGIMLALSDAVIIVSVSTFVAKLPAGKFELRKVWLAFREAWPALLMPVLVLGGLYGGLFTPTEAGAAAAGYAMIYGTLSKGRAFLKELMPTTIRAMNLTTIVFFLLGCVGIFQFFLANMGWPQAIADWVKSLGLSPLAFLYVLIAALLMLSMFLTGVAILVLTVPIIFPVALSMGVDPIHLGILYALAIEIGAVIPPVGLNLFAVSGVTGLPVTTVLKGSFPFCLSDTAVLLILVVMPFFALFLPSLIYTPIF